MVGRPGDPGPVEGWRTRTAAKGYESAVAYALAKRLGFSGRQVDWVPVTEAQALQPGSKPFDFYLGQVTYGSVRDRDVDFSYGYYLVPLALLARRTNPYSKRQEHRTASNTARTSGSWPARRASATSTGASSRASRARSTTTPTSPRSPGSTFGPRSAASPLDLPTAYYSGRGWRAAAHRRPVPEEGDRPALRARLRPGLEAPRVREQGPRAAHEPRARSRSSRCAG